MIQALAFYLFAGIITMSALMVISARNPVHSVLWLVLAFFNSAGLFVLLGAEFIAFLMVIVYVGAVAVLFLFVVMMLEIDFASLRKGAMQYVPLGVVIGGILLAELVFLFSTWTIVPVEATQVSQEITNTEALGMVLYTDYFLPFQIAGLILFVAMIGAIVLTHRKRPGVRTQDISAQHTRKPEEAMEVRKVATGAGA
jgi:NADH-quinone oxidoreductase subunit J